LTVGSGNKVVAVMSGNFVQRGEPAIYDKWRRTRMALEAGVDIVLEMPVPYVVFGADYFARAGVGILAATGVVDVLSFGSECGDIKAIRDAGHVLAKEPTEYKTALRTKLDSGVSFATARGAALEACVKNAPEGLFTKPNNGLAMEYCKALHLLGDPMDVFTTHRKSGGPSATKIRNEAKKNGKITELDDFSDIFRFLLYSRDFRLAEGLENRFINLCGEFIKISDIIAAVKTKRYTHTRLQRTVIQMLLDITSEAMAFFEKSGGVQYIRVLGFRKESADLLGRIVKRATLPVITHGAIMDAVLDGEYGIAAAKMLDKDLQAGDIYRCATRAMGGRRAERAIPIEKI